MSKCDWRPGLARCQKWAESEGLVTGDQARDGACPECDSQVGEEHGTRVKGPFGECAGCGDVRWRCAHVSAEGRA